MLMLSSGACALGAERAEPKADPKAQVVAGNARFTVLTPAMIRMEWSASGRFEDRASLAFVHRRTPVPRFSSTRDGGWVTIETDELTLRYRPDAGRFAKGNLSVALRGSGPNFTWDPSQRDSGNLLGTTRTLDSISGSCPLEPGLLSRDGWVVVDDSQRPLLTDADPPWVAPRRDAKALDWYFFGYGRDYTRALRDFTAVAGRIPLPPRFVFGAWWSRYWAYSDSELRDLVRQFREHDVPLDVLVVDMDWHLDGWTGYTWNPQYFPDPAGFLRWAHEQGLRVTLNLHPADGVAKHEKAFPEFARALGLDPETVEAVPFDCTDPRYMEAYFRLLHHPLERDGVDFWWIDWQQGTQTKIANLDPLTWLNHLHWVDMERNPERGGRRPLIFSRWGGLGNHRYQIGFSGDTYCNWASLAFQPYFTSTAGNVGYAYWSHDIGGHQPGAVEPELYARWIQWGGFSPILRTHTTKNPEAERRIWAFPDDVFRAARTAFHLRYELLPYIYTAARQCYDTAMPLCRPLYYAWPEIEEAYRRPDEYLFGDELLVAPVLRRRNRISGRALTRVWIPPGEWTHWFSGRTYRGPSEAIVLSSLDELPLFVRGGGIVAAGPRRMTSATAPTDPLILHIFPGESGETRVYDDDGGTIGYQADQFAWLPVRHAMEGDTRRIVIGPVQGRFPGMRSERPIEIRLRDVWPAETVIVGGQPLAVAADSSRPGWHYDSATLSLVVRLDAVRTGEVTEVSIRFSAAAQRTELLRDGLRGQLERLAVAADRLGAKVPGAVRNALALRAQFGAEAAKTMAAASAFGAAWPDVIASISQAGIDASLRTSVAASLLGVAFEMEAAPIEGDESGLRATLGANLCDAARFCGELDADVEFALPGGWSARERTTKQSGRLTPTQPLRAEATMRLNGPPQTAVLTGSIDLRRDGIALRVPADLTLLPSIGAWRVIGPFHNPFANGLKTVFPPETELKAGASYLGKDVRFIRWRTVTRPIDGRLSLSDEFRVDLHALFGARVYEAVAYAWTELHAPRAMSVHLAVGSDDGFACWVNGREVHRVAVGRAYMSRQDRVPIELREGANTVLLKIQQGGGDWSFAAHVETPDGRPIPEVETRLRP